MIVLYVFGIPLTAFFILRHNRYELHEMETRRKYSFLYAVCKCFCKMVKAFTVFQTAVQLNYLSFIILLNFCYAWPGRVTWSRKRIARAEMPAGITGSWSLCLEKLRSLLFQSSFSAILKFKHCWRCFSSSSTLCCTCLPRYEIVCLLPTLHCIAAFLLTLCCLYVYYDHHVCLQYCSPFKQARSTS